MFQLLLLGTCLPSIAIAAKVHSVCRSQTRELDGPKRDARAIPQMRDHPRQLSYGLEMEAQLRRLGARRDVVRAAESREKVIQRHFVRQVDDRKAKAPLVTVTVEELSWPTARSNRLRGWMRWGLWSSFSVPGAGIFTRVEANCDAGQKVGNGAVMVACHAVAGQTSLELLIRSQGQSGNAVEHAYASLRNRDPRLAVPLHQPRTL